MLSILRKVKGLNCRDLYFFQGYPEQRRGEDVQYFIQSPIALPRSVEFITSIVDLGLEEGAIEKGIKKGVSYEIRRARGKDLVEVRVIDAPTFEDIETFADFFDAFFASKKLDPANRKKLKELARNSGLVLSASFQESRPERFLSAHAYICDGSRARLLYSTSSVSLKAKEERQLLGRANRYLHWRMIQHFKGLGYREYDFGGISKRAELKTIDEFKESFGGREVLEYNLVRGVTLKGRMAVLVLNLLRILQKKNPGA